MGRLTHRTAPGLTYFVTTKTWDSHAIFQVPENARILIEYMMRYREQGAYLLHEFVVMPDHLHLILTPGDDTSLERAMQFIKGGRARIRFINCAKTKFRFGNRASMRRASGI